MPTTRAFAFLSSKRFSVGLISVGLNFLPGTRSGLAPLGATPFSAAGVFLPEWSTWHCLAGKTSGLEDSGGRESHSLGHGGDTDGGARKISEVLDLLNLGGSESPGNLPTFWQGFPGRPDSTN
jgi:hypothetical protein